MFTRPLPTRSGARRHLWIAVATVAVLLASAAPAQGAPFVYVTQHAAKVSQYEVVAGGLLVPMFPATVGTGVAPYGMAASPDGQSVYVATPGDDSVSQYDVGPGGRLSPKSPAKVAAGDTPFRVAVSPDGESVYVTDSYAFHATRFGTVWQYDVGAGGELSPKSPATVAAGVDPAEVAVSPDSRSVYVTDNTSLECSSSACRFDVWQYNIGPGGALSPKSPPAVDSGGGQPMGVAVSPDGETVYVVNHCARRTNICVPEKRSNVSQYNVGPGGELSPKSQATVATGDGANSVAVSPDGESVYVASQVGFDGESGYVSQYNVGPGGALSPKSPAKVAAGEGAFSVTVSPDGESVYVVNGWEGSLSRYDVGAGGELSPKSPAKVASAADPSGMAVSPAAPMPTAKKQCRHGGWKQSGFKKRRGCMRFVKSEARHDCLAARRLIGRRAFRVRYGKGKHHRRSMRRCVKQEIRR